jgi:hypothetical protein
MAESVETSIGIGFRSANVGFASSREPVNPSPSPSPYTERGENEGCKDTGGSRLHITNK